MFRKLLYIPGTVFNLWRQWDRIGGIESKSVTRFVGASASLETKKLQLKFNEQSKTPVWRRMAWGSIPHWSNGVPEGGLPGEKAWASLDVPVFLLAGEKDLITKPEELEKIARFMGKSHPVQIEVDQDSEPIPVDVSEQGEEQSSQILSITDEDFLPDLDTRESHEDPSTPNEGLVNIPPLSNPKRGRVLKTTVLPSPASHALLYQPTQSRVLAGLIQDFLRSQVSGRLNLGTFNTRAFVYS